MEEMLTLEEFKSFVNSRKKALSCCEIAIHEWEQEGNHIVLLIGRDYDNYYKHCREITPYYFTLEDDELLIDSWCFQEICVKELDKLYAEYVQIYTKIVNEIIKGGE